MNHGISPLIIERIRRAAAADPELSKTALAQRFGVTRTTVARALQNGAAVGKLTFPRGTSVKVIDPSGRADKARTGVVIDDALEFPWRDHRRVEFDPMPGKATTALVPVDDLRAIKPSDRPESARPREQVELFNPEKETP